MTQPMTGPDAENPSQLEGRDPPAGDQPELEEIRRRLDEQPAPPDGPPDEEMSGQAEPDTDVAPESGAAAAEPAD